MTRSRGRGVLPALLVSALAAALPRPAAGQCGPCPAPSFDRTPRGFYNVFGSLQDELARADLDRDGNLDLIVGNIGFPSGVAVFRGSPNGTFSAPTVFEPQNPGDSIGVADFDLDGLLDVVVTGFNQQQFAWVKGTGDGAFEAPVFIMLDTVVNRLAAGDFNGDGRPDVALLVYTGNQVQLRFGDGAGGFPSFVNLPVGPSATSLVVADLDGNDFGDLVVPNNGSNTVSVILGRPSLLFPPPRNFFAGTNPRGAVAADFDGDGIPDLGVAISQFMTEAQGVSILKGNGAGEFGSPTFVFSPHGRIVAGHFDGNATTDLVVYGFDRIARLLGDGHGGFSVTVAEGVEAPVLVAGDLNRDGIDDLVGRFGGAFAALLSSPGVLELPRFFEHVAGSPTAVGDLDGDGIADLAVSRFSGQIAILESNGAGGWTPGTALQLTSTPRSLLAADVNSDSKIDLIATAASAVVVFLASGGGAFGAGTPYNVSGGPTSVAAGRLDGDSNADLVVTLGGDNSLAVLRGTGGGSFAAPVTYAVGSFPQGARLAHFDADANLDVAVVNSGSVSVLLGNGMGAFSSISSFPISGSWSSIEVADFNGDTHQDVVVPLAGSDTAAMLPGDGLGSLGAAESFSVGVPYVQLLVSGDFNLDGRPDVALSSNEMVAVITRGVGSFDPPVLYSPAGRFHQCRPGDFDADGRPDLACASNTVVSLMRNTNCFPRHFSIGQDPSACNASGIPFSTQPVVRVEDDGGNAAVCASGLVTASLVPGGDPTSVLNGTTLHNTFSGTVAYSNLSVTGSGVAHRILFRHDGVGSAYSRTFSTGLSAISAPSAVCPSTPGHAAAVLDAGFGVSYAWEIVNGAITSGQGTRRIEFTSGASGPVTLRVRVLNGPACSIEREIQVAISGPPCAPPNGFFTLAPCRLADTRDPPGATGEPALSSGAVRAFPVAGRCGVPATARSVAVNLTVINPTGAGYLTAFPGGTPIPGSSTINFRAGAVRANNAILPLGAAGDLAIFCALSAPGTSHFALDVTGYFE